MKCNKTKEKTCQIRIHRNSFARKKCIHIRIILEICVDRKFYHLQENCTYINARWAFIHVKVYRWNCTKEAKKSSNVVILRSKIFFLSRNGFPIFPFQSLSLRLLPIDMQKHQHLLTPMLFHLKFFIYFFTLPLCAVFERQ